MTPRRLERIEINLLKHLVRHTPWGFPVVVPEKFRSALVPLWREGFINIWYRQDCDQPCCRPRQFVSLTVDGHRRIDSIIANTPEFESRRLAGFQGRRNVNDQSPKPQQEE